MAFSKFVVVFGILLSGVLNQLPSFAMNLNSTCGLETKTEGKHCWGDTVNTDGGRHKCCFIDIEYQGNKLKTCMGIPVETNNDAIKLQATAMTSMFPDSKANIECASYYITSFSLLFVFALVAFLF